LAQRRIDPPRNARLSTMALRPWNVFQKTLFAVRPEAGAGRISVTTQLSLARARLQIQEPTIVASTAQCAAILLPASATVWLLLFAAQWRYSDPSRLRAVEEGPGGVILLDLLGSRLAAHLGPYQVPNFVRGRLHETPLKLLSEESLPDYKRAYALSRLGQISQRQVAIVDVLRLEPAGSTGAYNLLDVVTVLRSAFESQTVEVSAAPGSIGTMSTSLQDAAVRIVLDIVSALPPEERSVPGWVLSSLVAARGTPWSDGPQGEELKASLLLQLLRTPSNCELAAALPDVLDYVQQPGIKAKADTVFPIRAYLLSGETPDLLRRCSRLIGKQCPGTVELPPRAPRDTPRLQAKHDVRNAWTTALITVCWASFRAWRGILDVNALIGMSRASASALAGMGVLEGLWRLEERMIESRWYYEDASLMLPCSAAMCLTNAVAWSWAFRLSALAPFVACRLVKDDFLDAYRSFEP